MADSGTTDVDPVGVIKRAQFSLLVLYTLYAEGRICKIAEEGCKHFVRGREGSRLDAGLYTGPVSVFDGASNRCERLLASSDSKMRVMIGLDVKTIMPRQQHQSTGWITGLTEAQFSFCRVLLVNTPRDPEHIAVLPLFAGTPWSKPDQGYYALPFRVSRLLHPLPAFPPDWGAYIIPTTMLPLTLTELVQYVCGEADDWVNPHTGISFAKGKRPQLATPDTCLGAERYSKSPNAFAFVASVFDAFERYQDTSNFTIKQNQCKPLFGDFKFVEKHSGQEIFVEAKLGPCSLKMGPNGRVTQMSYSPVYRGGGAGSTFTWKAQWDYILATVREPNTDHRALFLPRDEIPSDWWNHAVEGESKLKWPSMLLHKLNGFLVRIKPRQAFFDDIHAILASRSRSGQLRASKHIPVSRIPLGADAADIDSEGYDKADLDLTDEESFSASERGPGGRVGKVVSLDETDDDETKTTEHDPDVGEKPVEQNYHVGYGRSSEVKVRSTTYEQWQADLLLERCRHSGQGLVIDLGSNNKVNRYAIVRWIWSDTDKIRYDRTGEPPRRACHFDKAEPTLPLAFLKLMWRHARPGTQDESHRWFQRQIVERRPDSLVICDMSPTTCSRLRHNLFIFPSMQITNLAESKPNIAFNAWLSHKAPPVDRYHLDYNNVIPAILRLLDGKRVVLWGTLDEKVHADRLCRQLAETYDQGKKWFNIDRRVAKERRRHASSDSDT